MSVFNTQANSSEGSQSSNHLFQMDKADVELWKEDGELITKRHNCIPKDFFKELKQQARGKYILIFRFQNKLLKRIACTIKGGK
jgi:hypothetical protein